MTDALFSFFNDAAIVFPDISPALFTLDLSIVGLPKFPIRWYALGYIFGIGFAWYYALAILRRPALWGGTPPATKTQMDDLIFWAMLGVILGGRFGFVLLYQVMFQFDVIAADPLKIFKAWEGGMSFHGGLIGVGLAIWMFAWRNKLSTLSLQDIGGVVAPFGIFLVRCANFVNAELYGRKTDAPWGVIFPEGRGSGGVPYAYNWEAGAWAFSGLEYPRHPSQLYEAAAEGLLPLLVIGVLIWRFGALRRPGLVAGVFLLIYGISRFNIEFFRLPDSFIADTTSLWMNFSWGQYLCIPMILLGAYWVFNAYRKPRIES